MEEENKKKQGLLKTILSYKPVLYFFTFLAFFAAFILIKDYALNLYTNINNKKLTHEVKNDIDINVKGFNKKVELQKVNKFVKKKLIEIENFKNQEKENFNKELKEILDENFNECYKSINLFADWYYSYTTQYKILASALKEMINSYRAGLNGNSLLDSAQKGVIDYIHQKYVSIVLKPSILQPKLVYSIKTLVLKYKEKKDNFFKQIDNDFQDYITRNPDNLSKVTINEIKIDWENNVQNINLVESLKEKSAIGSGAILSASAISGIIGAKMATSAATKTLASKIIVKTGLKKVLASVAMKVGLAPITFGASVVLGFLTDYGLNKADEKLYRDEFVKVTKENLDNLKKSIFLELKNKDIIEKLYNMDLNLYKNFVK